MYEPLPGARVLIVTHGCHVLDTTVPLRLSHEHKEIALFTREELPGLVMPDGYKRSIHTWYDRAPTPR
ncbi:hypothetical protein GCM10023085_10770 [Actinomadura viridis]|uniref:Uncharacterized protein n=1 Tax=Actinomadura viridis TaxID=58110 RepID=A0A931DJ04_9ACTN|nr:hypothetical protein [Actinomadura viridis]